MIKISNMFEVLVCGKLKIMSYIQFLNSKKSRNIVEILINYDQDFDNVWSFNSQ